MIRSPVVLITGASRGLGRAMALAFAQKGYAVGINYRENELEAKATEELIRPFQVPTLLLPADVSDSRQVIQMVQQLIEAWGRLDVLVNNAGIARNRSIAKMSDSEWREVMAVNLDGVFYCSRAVIPLMRKQKGGAIVNISSYTAQRGIRGAGNYASAKAGVITLTRNIALEEGRFNIRANAVMPGFHKTDMNKDIWDEIEPDVRPQHLLTNLPDREEMAKFVVMVSELKSVSGQVFSFESRVL